MTEATNDIAILGSDEAVERAWARLVETHDDPTLGLQPIDYDLVRSSFAAGYMAALAALAAIQARRAWADA